MTASRLIYFNAVIPRKRSRVLVVRLLARLKARCALAPRCHPRRVGELRILASLITWTTLVEAAVTVNYREPESIWCLPVTIPRQLPTGLRQRD